MSDFNTVDPVGWEYDLHSIYSAYMGYFQLQNIPWYEKSWGTLFESFDEFLGFSWPVIIVTDSWTARAHIVTRMSHIQAFLKMIKTRFGETLPLVENVFKVSPFETSRRPVRTITDQTTYRKAHATLAGAVLCSLKARIRSGEPKLVTELWNSKQKTFLAIDFEWSERNTTTCLEWGYAAVRCSHLDALGIWPPEPESNYRRGHYIVAEHIDKVQNKYSPSVPWEYAFGDSQVIPKVRLPLIIEAIISSLSSPDSEMTANDLVLVAHGINGDLQRLAEMKIKLPHNMLIIDSATFEKQLFSLGHRGPMVDPQSGKSRAPKTMISLSAVFHSLGVDVPCAFHNSGNDAYLTLLALQLLLDRDNTRIPSIKGRSLSRGRSPVGRPISMHVPLASAFPMTPLLSPNPIGMSLSMNTYLDADFGVARRTPGHTKSTSSRRGKGGSGKDIAHRRSVAVDELSVPMSNLKTV